MYTHTAVSSEQTHTHTHTVNTHPEQRAAIYAAAPGEQLGVRCLAQGSHLSRGIEGGKSAGHSLPRPLGYKSDSLSIRPRLPKKIMFLFFKEMLVLLPAFFKISYFMFNIRKKQIQVWKDMKVSK